MLHAIGFEYELQARRQRLERAGRDRAGARRWSPRPMPGAVRVAAGRALVHLGSRLAGVPAPRRI